MLLYMLLYIFLYVIYVHDEEKELQRVPSFTRNEFNHRYSCKFNNLYKTVLFELIDRKLFTDFF